MLYSVVTMSVVAGKLVQKYVMQQTQLSLQTIVIGVVSVAFISLIPLLGPVLIMALFLIVFGATIERLYLMVRSE
jgi:hypothetical protein